jgi:hypothetical protein
VSDPLEELRAAGVAKQSEADRQLSLEQHQKRQRVIDDGKRATSIVGDYVSAEWLMGILACGALSVVMTGVGLYAIATSKGKHVDANEMLPWSIGGIGLSILALIGFGLAKMWVRASARDEEAWAAGLPFPLTGHFHLLGSGYSYFRLQFRGDAPSDSTLTELFAGLKGFQLTTVSGSNPFRIKAKEARGMSNRDHWHAWRLVVDQLLLPLHAKWPIASVTFEED